VPTVAFNFRKIRKGAVTLKIWDVAGQPKFRSMWERYCHGMDAVMYVSFRLSLFARAVRYAALTHEGGFVVDSADVCLFHYSNVPLFWLYRNN